MTNQAPESRHCTHCGGHLLDKGQKEIHEGNSSPLLLHKMVCRVYVCGNCGHVEFFYPSDQGEVG
jgi:DNA-directed RNA polymerase subunit RPC12/RpoP